MRVSNIQKFSKTCNDSTNYKSVINCCPSKSGLCFEGKEKVVKQEGFFKKVFKFLDETLTEPEHIKKQKLEKEIEDNDKYHLWGRE